MATSSTLTICMNETVFDQKPIKHSHGSSPKKEIRKIPNPYLLFCKERRTSLHRTNPDMPSRDVTKLLADEWKNMSDNEKNKYKQNYQSKIKNQIHDNEIPHDSNNSATSFLNFTLPNGQMLYIPVSIIKPGR